MSAFRVVMQGPTSTGKTSLVAHLAAQTGHRCVRINNHEQTDLQVWLLRLPPCKLLLRHVIHIPCTAVTYLGTPGIAAG